MSHKNSADVGHWWYSGYYVPNHFQNNQLISQFQENYQQLFLVIPVTKSQTNKTCENITYAKL